MEISFEGITVKSKAGREILSNVSGSCAQGTFYALMGPSGSGKTSLLSTLSRRFEPNLTYTGHVRYNGRKWNVRDRRAIAFVQQDDILPFYLTVEDFLLYSAQLRLDVSDEVRKERVEKVIAKLRLEKCRSTVIGNVAQRGVSGGERKRTSIANELLTEPLVCFTDEPTSGLDSTLSNVVIEILKGLANDGLTIVSTIHSPSSAIFEQFDSLLVLSEGKVFYRGKASGLAGFLGNLGRPVPAMFNTAEFLLDLLVLEPETLKEQKFVNAMSAFVHLDSASASTVSHDGQVDDHDSQAKALTNKRKSTMSGRGKAMLKSVSVIFRPGDEDMATEEVKQKKFARSFFVQVKILTSRLWQRYKTDIFTRNQIGSTLGLMLISGLLFFQLGFSEEVIFSRVALSLWLVGTTMYLSTFSTSFALQDDIPLVKKEIYDGSYSLAAHVVAKQIVLYPNDGFWAVVFDVLVLLFTRLAPSVGYGVLVILTVQASVFLFQGIGLFLSASVPTSGLVVVVVVVVTYFFAFNGFFAPFPLMPWWYRWLRYPCFLQYSYQLVMTIVFPTDSPAYSCGSPSSYSVCSTGNNESMIHGNDVLAQWDIDLSPATCILVIILCGFVIRVLAYFAYSVRMAPPKGISENDAHRSRWCCSCRKRREVPIDETGKPVADEKDQDDGAVQIV